MYDYGTRVRLTRDVERYPHFIAPKGAVGTVVNIGDADIYAVRLDLPLPGAEEWNNEVHWIRGYHYEWADKMLPGEYAAGDLEEVS